MRIHSILISLASGSSWELSSEPFLIRSEISEWSGPVTWVEVGSPRQNIKVSIDSTSSSWVLWDQGEWCPAFIDGGCFNSSESRTFTPLGGMYYRERVWIGGIGHEAANMAVNHADFFRDATNLYGRDVAGSLGIGPWSNFKDYGALAVSEDEEGPFVTIRGFDDKDSSLEYADTQIERQMFWTFTAMFGSRELEIVYDIAEPDFVVPRALVGQVFSDVLGTGVLILSENGRLMIKCDLLDSIKLVLRINPLFNIHIPPDLLVVPQAEQRDGFCHLGIRVDDSHRTNLFIGRLLTKSVKAVVLDYDASRMGFVPLEARQPTFSALPVTRLPKPLMFGTPKIVDNAEAIVMEGLSGEYKPNSGNDQFILESEKIHRLGYLSDGSSLECWTFLRFSGIPSRSGKVISDRFSGMEFQIRDGDIRFELSKSSFKRTVTVEFLESGNRLFVCKKVSPFYQFPDLPNTVVAENDREAPCSICLLAMGKGDADIQPMPNCQHEFHHACVVNWLLRSADKSCPLCRGHVDRITLHL